MHEHISVQTITFDCCLTASIRHYRCPPIPVEICNTQTHEHMYVNVQKKGTCVQRCKLVYKEVIHGSIQVASSEDAMLRAADNAALQGEDRPKCC